MPTGHLGGGRAGCLVSDPVTKARACLLTVVLLAGLGACSDDSPGSDSAAPTTDAATTAAPSQETPTSEAPTSEAPVTEPGGVEPNGESVDVQAIDNNFRPEQVEISAGTEVVWTNAGRNEHNVIPVEGDDWGVPTEEFVPKDVYSHVFTTPGTYAYYCSIHGTAEAGMIGTIVVTG